MFEQSETLAVGGDNGKLRSGLRTTHRTCMSLAAHRTADLRSCAHTSLTDAIAVRLSAQAHCEVMSLSVLRGLSCISLSRYTVPLHGELLWGSRPGRNRVIALTRASENLRWRWRRKRHTWPYVCIFALYGSPSALLCHRWIHSAFDIETLSQL